MTKDEGRMTKEAQTESWFDSEERVAILQFRAAHWMGTPFFGNSCTAGPKGGVSCQKLVGAIYRECGCCDIAVPEVDMAHAKFSKVSLVEPFMATRPEFERLPGVRWGQLVAGDLLGLVMGRVVHHLGILLGDGRRERGEGGKAGEGHYPFVHAMDGIGVSYGSLRDWTWGGRLSVVWRPVGENAENLKC